MKFSETSSNILHEYYKFRKHYCSKCKYYTGNKCLRHRLVMDCVKKGLKNV